MAKAKPALEIKGRLLSITRIRVLEDDAGLIEAQVANLARQLGPAAQGLPVLIEAEQALDLGPLLRALRGHGIRPLAAIEGALDGPAAQAGLPLIPADVLSEAAAKPGPAPAPAAPAAPTPAPAPAPARRTRIVTEPVRSGQQIYAEGSDLILLAAVSAGAEVIADGCVHVYARLAGRAIAGARGDESARVFCKRMEAELLAVAGVYAVAEQIQGELRGKPAQALIAHGKLMIDKLDW
ncbi:MAG TPA: septum site-determining protein MinC [Nevskiaceae bacterium]|nr:septum site-determining protein MinC [Nevskiaceae bacterium]